MREALIGVDGLTAGPWSLENRARMDRAARSAWDFAALNFSLLGLRVASFIGLIAMATLPAEFYITITTALTVVGSIVLQILATRENRRRYERTRQETIDRYQHERQERFDHQEELKLEIARVAAVTRAAATSLKDDIRANTALTVEAAVKADAAYDAANHVNEKIANLQAGTPPVSS